MEVINPFLKLNKERIVAFLDEMSVSIPASVGCVHTLLICYVRV